MELKRTKDSGLFPDGYTVGGVASFLAKGKTPSSSDKKKQKRESTTQERSALSALFSPISPFMSAPGVATGVSVNKTFSRQETTPNASTTSHKGREAKDTKTLQSEGTPRKRQKKAKKVETPQAEAASKLEEKITIGNDGSVNKADNVQLKQQGKRKSEDGSISSKKKLKGEKRVKNKDKVGAFNGPDKNTESATTSTEDQASDRGKGKKKKLIPVGMPDMNKSSGNDVSVVQMSKGPANTAVLPKKKKKTKKRKASENIQETPDEVTVEQTGHAKAPESSELPKKKRKKKKPKSAEIVPLSDSHHSKDHSGGKAESVCVQNTKDTKKVTVKKSLVPQTSEASLSPKVKKQHEKQDGPSRNKKNSDSKILAERESLLKNADEQEETRKEHLKKKQEEKMRMLKEVEAANPTPGKRLRDPERDQRTVFVGNLPVSTTKKELKKMFRKFGEVESVRFRSIAQSNPNVSKRVAMMRQEIQEKKKNMNCYVVFTEEKSAQAALKRNGTIVGGSHHIRVDLASNSQKFDHKLSVFVGNLPFDVADDSVYEHFSQCGEVEGVRIIRDGKSGLGKGFGYVLFQDTAAVGLALRLNEKSFSGRKIRVKRAVKKEKVKNTSLSPASATKGGRPFQKGKLRGKGADQEPKFSRKGQFKSKDKDMGFKKKQQGKKERWRNKQKPGLKGGFKTRGK